MEIELVDPAEADRYGVARRVLAAVPMSVVLIGAGEAEQRSCATGTAMYVSFAPPRFAVALHPGSRTCAHVLATGRFSISVLRDDQVDLAGRAGRSGGGPDKFAGLGLDAVADGSGTPALAGAPLIAWCEVVETHGVGDHRLFVGQVTAYAGTGLDASGTLPALVRYLRRYASIGPWLSEEAPEGYPT